MSTTRERLVEYATIGAAVLALLTLGYVIGKDTNDGLTNFLREKYQVAEKTESQMRAEISALKLELQSGRLPAQTTSQKSSAGAGEPTTSPPSSSTGSPIAKSKEEDKNPRVSLYQSQSADLFDGQLSISLVGVKFEGDPLRHRVIAIFGSPGKERKTVDTVDVGFSTQYNGFEIVVVSAGTMTATFRARRLDPKT